MKFTVITIAYNEENYIAETMLSVLNQSYKDLEYLILDGNSSDGTLETAKKLAEEFDRDVKIYSEPDFGIYNAMNRGIARASGDYVIFMNAKDSFWNYKVLTDMAGKIGQNTIAIYYGKTYLTKNGRRYGIRDFAEQGISVYDALMKGYMPVHQSIAAPLDILRRNYFNEAYKIRADYDWLLRCYKEGVKFANLDMMVCRYDCSGFSSITDKGSCFRIETSSIRKKIYPMVGRYYEWQDRIYDTFRKLR